MSGAKNPLLENLRRFLAAQAAARDCDEAILSKLARINRGLELISRDQSLNYSELVKSRDAVSRLLERVARIERGLEDTPL